MLDVRMTISGLDELRRTLSPSRLPLAIDNGVTKAGQVTRDGVKLMPPVSAKTTGYGVEGIPVDTSRLRNSIDAQKVALFGSIVQPHVDYAEAVYFGRGKMPPRPFFEWFLKDFGGLQKIQDAMNEEIAKAVAA